MKAIVSTQYGSPDVLSLQDVSKPELKKDDDVLIKVHASAINPADWRMLRGKPFIGRLAFGLRKPSQPILGQDIAGVVEAVGVAVTSVQVGDRVFGELSAQFGGGFAEYTSAPEKFIAPMPANCSFEQAATVPLAGVTALQGLRTHANVQAGEKVLINGASGGVGTFAVQIAKALGAEVTGVCSTRNLDLVRSLGADHVIDYTKTDFTQNGERYDVILEVVGNRSVNDLKRCLAPDGRCIVVGFDNLSHLLQVVMDGLWASWRSDQKFLQMPSAQANHEDLLFLKSLLEAETITPVIDRTYALAQVTEALHYLETGRARGKVVVKIAE